MYGFLILWCFFHLVFDVICLFTIEKTLKKLISCISLLRDDTSVQKCVIMAIFIMCRNHRHIQYTNNDEHLIMLNHNDNKFLHRHKQIHLLLNKLNIFWCFTH